MDGYIYNPHQIKFIVREEEMERMKMSPEAIAEKMNKPLDMVKKVIKELVSKNNV